MGDEGIETLLGEVIINIEGLRVGGYDRVIFFCLSGKYVQMIHHQDCCESVSIEDIVGDSEDLLYSKVTTAELVTNDGTEEDSYEHITWSFYKIGTEKGEVTIRWYGSSNGYYSETVDVETSYVLP